MPRSRSRRTARVSAAARSARARDRQIADMFAPLDPEGMLEAEGYLVDAIEAKIGQLDAELVDLRGKLRALPLPAPLGSAALVEADALDNELTHIGDARGELEAMLDAVRNRRRFHAPGTLALITIQGRSRALLAEAERLGAPVDAAALAEAKRREGMISQWLLHFEPADGVDLDLAALPPAAR